MKRVVRFLGVFICLLVLNATFFPVSAYAAVIDTDTGSKGYFTVNYSADTQCKMKIGVTHKNGTVYYTYVPGTESAYPFMEGNGTYTITLFRNTSGTSYTGVTSAKTVVELENEFVPYLASTAEITFSQEDAVGKKAAELCAELTDDAAKIVAIHNYIAGHFTYDDEFAAQVRSGAVKNYVPNTETILAAEKGVCYDFSALFAAMCRSQGIPCKMEKGYRYGGYHAWNAVYVEDAWRTVDLTVSISRQASPAEKLADCTI